MKMSSMETESLHVLMIFGKALMVELLNVLFGGHGSCGILISYSCSVI